MEDLSNIIKLGALFLLGVGALLIAYKCAGWIYRLTTCPPQPPTADVRPVPDAENITPITEAVTFERRVRTGT